MGEMVQTRVLPDSEAVRRPKNGAELTLSKAAQTQAVTDGRYAETREMIGKGSGVDRSAAEALPVGRIHNRSND